MADLKAKKELLAESLKCSICMNLFSHPSTIQCQHTYCKKCIEKEENGVCPMCKDPYYVVPGENKAIAEVISVLFADEMDKIANEQSEEDLKDKISAETYRKLALEEKKKLLGADPSPLDKITIFISDNYGSGSKTIASVRIFIDICATLLAFSFVAGALGLDMIAGATMVSGMALMIILSVISRPWEKILHAAEGLSRNKRRSGGWGDIIGMGMNAIPPTFANMAAQYIPTIIEAAAPQAAPRSARGPGGGYNEVRPRNPPDDTYLAPRPVPWNELGSPIDVYGPPENGQEIPPSTATTTENDNSPSIINIPAPTFAPSEQDS